MLKLTHDSKTEEQVQPFPVVTDELASAALAFLTPALNSSKNWCYTF